MADTKPTAPADGVVPSADASPKEDAATESAREELKHAAISEKQQGSKTTKTDKEEDKQSSRPSTPDSKSTVAGSAVASALLSRSQDSLVEQVSSPKKKRAHDEVDNDDNVDAGAGSKKNKDNQSSSSISSSKAKTNGNGDAAAGAPSDTPQDAAAASNGTSTASPSSSAEPEKKRLRDQPSEKEKVPPSSSSAFASSGFAKLSSSASPFGALGSGGPAAAGKTSLFGSFGSSSASPFGTLLSATASATTPAPAATAPETKTETISAPSLAGPPKLSFDGASASSPFASLPASSSTKVFGSGFGGGNTATPAAGTGGGFGGAGGFGGFGGFGGGFSSTGATGGAFGGSLAGPGLTSFAKPGEALKSAKPARPFGAPESSEEEDEDGDDDEGSGAEDGENGDDDDERDEAKEAEDLSKEKKKKQKLQRVVVDDGEAGEATLLQVRARMYYMDKDLGGWKERGAGMLKINVPEQCVEYDRDGAVIPASFDASTLEDDAYENGGGDDDDDDNDDGGDDDDSSDAEKGETGAPKARTGTGAATRPKRTVVRLIMRQDSTHRVILNTVVLAATEFKERQTLKSTAVLFTAFEGPEAKPVNVQMKLNINNAKTFLAAMEGIQRELRGV